jgi:hypothetical protein
LTRQLGFGFDLQVQKGLWRPLGPELRRYTLILGFVHNPDLTRSNFLRIGPAAGEGSGSFIQN